MGKAEQQFEHLTDAQIENYGDRTSGEGPNQNGLEADQAIETHLADCAGCRTRVLEFHRSRFGLMSDPFPSAAWQSQPPTAECPSEDALQNLAAGLSSTSESATLTQHAAQCPHCGPILRAYAEDFSDDLSAEDRALLSELKSSSPEWQRKMAQQMANAVSVAPAISASSKARVTQPPSAVQKSEIPSLKPWGFRLPSLKWLLVPAGAIACALIAFFIWNAQRETPQKVEKLVAQAYTENRTIEMRLPGAAWGQMRTTRGSGSFSTPLPLLEAADSIQQQSQKTLRRTDWLNARAQAEILTGNPSQQLLQDLKIGTQQHPDSVPLLFDLAVAYFKVGEISSDSNYYLQSKAALDEILRRSPSNSTALFNRALVEERLAMRDAAVADLNACLASEQDPAWANEARRRLERLKQLN